MTNLEPYKIFFWWILTSLLYLCAWGNFDALLVNLDSAAEAPLERRGENTYKMDVLSTASHTAFPDCFLPCLLDFLPGRHGWPFSSPAHHTVSSLGTGAVSWGLEPRKVPGAGQQTGKYIPCFQEQTVREILNLPNNMKGFRSCMESRNLRHW